MSELPALTLTVFTFEHIATDHHQKWYVHFFWNGLGHVMRLMFIYVKDVLQADIKYTNKCRWVLTNISNYIYFGISLLQSTKQQNLPVLCKSQ